MARFVVFNNMTLVHPGALSKIDVTELAQVGFGVTGVVGLIGEADGGQPNTLTSNYIPVLYDGSRAADVYKSGPLVDAIKIAFNSSSDSRISSGAYCVRPVKVNQSTKSDIDLFGQATLGTDTDHQLNIESLDYGLHTTQISLFPEVDAVNSNKYQITIQFEETKEIVNDIGGRPLMNLTFKGPEEPLISYQDSGNASLTDATTIADTDVTTEAVAGMYAYIKTAAIGTSVGEFRRITTVTPSTSVVVGDGFTESTGAITYDVVGGMIFHGPIKTIASESTTPVITLGSDPGGGGVDIKESTDSVFDNMIIRVMSGDSQGQQRVIASSTETGGDVELTLATGHGFSTDIEAGDEIAIIDVDATATTATIAGSAGVAATLETDTTWGSSWNSSWQSDFTGGELEPLTLSVNKSVYDLVQEINATLALSSQDTGGGNWIAHVGYGRDQTLATSLFDFDSQNASVDISVDRDFEPYDKARFLDDLNQLITGINNYSSLASATRSTTLVADATKTGAGFPKLYSESAPAWLTGGTRGTASNSDWQAAYDALLKERVNIVVPLMSRNQSSETYTDSTGTWLSNVEMLKSHVQLARGIAKSERNAYASCYYTGSGALKNVLDAAGRCNDEDISLCFQSPTVLNASSNLVEMQPWAMAVTAAGMQAGSTVGTALTYKFPKVSAVNNNSSECDPLDRTTSNQLLLNGVLFTEFVRGKGHRWVRHLTTYAGVDNLAKTDVNVNEIVKYIMYEVRTFIEERYTGLGATRSVVGGIKSDLSAKLEVYRSSGLITDAEDPATGEDRYAYNISSVTLSGDVLNISYYIIPVPAINYELITMHVQLPVLSA